MKPDLQIAYLRTLIAIEEEGSFGAAAARVGRTQSAVSQQMRSLEAAIGTPLFAARGRQRVLTEAGQTLLRHGHEIISLCNQAATASQRSQNTGTVRLGAPLEIAELLLPAVLERFACDHPLVRVAVTIDRSPRLMRRIDAGELDLVLSTRRTTTHKSVFLINLPVFWIAARGWEHRAGDPLPLALTDEPSMFRRIALSALDLSGLPYIEKVTSPSMNGVRLAVVSGVGITARTRSPFFAGTHVLDRESNLPPLPDVSYYMHRGGAGDQPETMAIWSIVQHIVRDL